MHALGEPESHTGATRGKGIKEFTIIKQLIMAQNIVLKTCWASDRNLASQLLQIEVGGVHLSAI